MMTVPARIPLLKIFSVILFLYAIFWISLEGRLWQSILLAIGVTIVAAGYAWQRYLGGRTFSLRTWLIATGLSGMLFGLLVGLLTILLMVVKTGLHGHGPEFTTGEISWVLEQIPLWSTIGLLAGLGAGVLITGFRNQ